MSRPQYRSGLGWILGVAFEDTLTRPVRLAQGFTCVRCCGTPRASSPHDLTAPALASHDGRDCVQLPLARGCYHLAPRRTFTSNPVPMPGTPSATASGGFGLDKRLASDILRRQGFDGQERASSGPPTRLPGPDTTQIFLLTKKTSYKVEPGDRPAGDLGQRGGPADVDPGVGIARGVELGAVGCVRLGVQLG